MLRGNVEFWSKAIEVLNEGEEEKQGEVKDSYK